MRGVGLALCASLASLPALAQQPGKGFDTYEVLKLSCDGIVQAVNTGIAEGHLNASLLAAELFDGGTCVGKDPARAAGVLDDAARKGSTVAAQRLALKFALGDGVPQSYAMAGAWFLGKAQGTAPLTTQDYSRGYASAIVALAMRNAQFPRSAAEVGAGADLAVALNPLKPLEAEIKVTSRRSRALATGSMVSRDYGKVYERMLRGKIEEAVAKLPPPKTELLVDAVVKRNLSFHFTDRGTMEMVEDRILNAP
jgi:hypothetical protein